MGGKALKAFGVSRIPAKKYFILKTELLFLANKYQIYPEVPREDLSKVDYGDIDLLIDERSRLSKNFPSFFSELSAEGSIVNGSVTSCVWQGVQVDLIFCKNDALAFTHFYLSYAILGMILGVICRQLGYKFAMDGLYFRDGSKQGILITKDISKALRFLGYDYNNWLSSNEKYTTRNEVYKFLQSGDFFDVLYDISKYGAAKHRKRERQSEAYQAFVSWVQKQNGRRVHNIYNEYDAMLLLRQRLPEEYAAIEIEIARKRYAEYKRAQEASRYTFKDFSEAYTEDFPGAKDKNIGEAYRHFLTSIYRKNMLTDELREKAKTFLRSLKLNKASAKED